MKTTDIESGVLLINDEEIPWIAASMKRCWSRHDFLGEFREHDRQTTCCTFDNDINAHYGLAPGYTLRDKKI